MKKLFGKRKKEEGSAGPPASATAGTNVPPLPLQQMPGSGYSNTGYLQSPGGAGTERSGGPPRTTVSRTQSGLSRTQSGMSSGRRSARRPREFIDLSQPEQVDASGTDEDGSSWEGSQGSWGPQDFAAAAAAAAASSPLASTPGVSAAEQEMLDADLALAYQLAMQDQQQQQQMQPAALHPRQPQPPPPPWQQQQQQHHPPVQSMPALQQPAHSMQAQQQPPAAQQSLPVQQQDSRQRQPRMGFLSSLSLSLNSRSSMTGGQPAGSKDRSEDLAVAAALAESQFAARQQAEMDRQHGSLEAAYQAAITQALEESMVTINYDDLLREIQLWIYDLEGATSDVNKALEDAREKVAEVNRQLAEADPDDAEGWHRIVWLSEQYPLVEERLRLVEGRVAPVNTGVRGLKDLREYIRQDEPPLADAEAVRDQIISRLFEQLGNQGLDAHHPFNAFGDKEEEKRGSLRTLMSLGRSKSTDKVKAPRGGDLRDMVRQLIEEAQRIPDAPPLPVDYEQLLTDLVRWIEECEAANGDVDTAIQEVRQMLEEAEAQRGEATEDPFDPHWHRVVFLSEQYPLAEGRLIEMLERIAPTNVLAQTFRDLKQHIETSKPTLAEAEAARDAGISTLFSGLAANGLQAGNLPPAPQTSDMRDIVARGIEEAKRIPELPPVPVDYSRLRVNVSEWIEQLEATNQDVLSTKLEVQQLVQQNESEKATATEDVYDEGWHRIVWLSEQYPLADGRVDAVGSQAKSTVPALESLRALQARIDGDAPPPLSDAQADLDATITTLLTELSAAGLDTASLPDAPQGINVRQIVHLALDEAKRIPAAPPVPVDYSRLRVNVSEWIEQLEATNQDVLSTKLEVQQLVQQNESEKATATEDVYDEGWHRIVWLSEQYPLADGRVDAVSSQAKSTVPAVESLRALQARIDGDAPPPLSDAQADLDATITTLLTELGAAGLDTASLPDAPQGINVRQIVHLALDEAKRIPAAPPVPVDYSRLRVNVSEWIEQLEATNQDVLSTKLEVQQLVQQNESEKATATEDVYDEGWHRIVWLSEQYPLADGRVDAVSSQAKSTVPALESLRALQARIDGDAPPPLADAQADLDATITTLLTELGAAGLDTASLTDAPQGINVRQIVHLALDEAKRIPAAPPVPVDYSHLRVNVSEWIEQLEATNQDVLSTKLEVQQLVQQNESEKATATEDVYDEGWHRIVWLSEQYPLADGRVDAVGSQARQSFERALEALRALQARIDGDAPPPLADAQADLDATITTLLTELGAAGLDTASLPDAPQGINVRQIVHLALDEAKRIPAAPPVPVDYSRLRVNVSEWIEQLEATNQDVLSTKLEVQQLVQQNESEKATATEDVYDEGWHRIVWLSEQYPLADGRVDAVSSQAKSTVPALEPLRALQARIDGDAPPPLADAQADLDATITTLLTELGAAGLDTASLPDAPQGINVRQIVHLALDEAKRIPAAPPVPVDYSHLRVNVSEWIEQLEATNQDVLSTKLEVQQLVQQNESEKATATEDVYDEGWHRIVWLSEQYPLADGRVDAVGSQARQSFERALEALRALQARIDGDAPPPLADAQADLDATITTLLTELGAAGLDTASLPDAPQGINVRQIVHLALDEAKRIPAAPPVPVDYSRLRVNVSEWIEQLEATNQDVLSTKLEVQQLVQQNESEKATATEDVYDEGWHRIVWLSEQYPLADGRVDAVSSQAKSTVPALESLRALQARIDGDAPPPLADAQADLDATITTLLTELGAAGLDTASLPDAPQGINVRQIVHLALDEAKRIPAAPPVPVDYSHLRVNVSEWIEQLEATNQDVLSTKLEVQQLVQQNESEKATATEDVYDEGWHRIVWLSEQYPLADGRVDAVSSQAKSTVPALESLRALQARIDGDAPPPLADAQADLDATITTLLTELGAAGLDTASLTDAPQGINVRQIVHLALDEAKRIPAAPPVPVDYSHLRVNVSEWIEQLEATNQDVLSTKLEVQQLVQQNESEKATATEDVYDEGWHRIVWLSEQYPLADGRVDAVSSQAKSTVPALESLRALQARIDGDAPPPLADAQADLDATITTLLTELGAAGLDTASLPDAPQGINVRQIVHLALDEAKRIPAAPPVPVDYSRLRVNVSEWIEQLEATNQDVLSTKLEVQQLVQQNESEKATATEDVYDEGWHRIVWLSEQYPLADGRVDAVSSQAKSTVPALESLRALQARIDGDAPPPLADAQADLDATITTLLTELGAAGLDTASLPDAPQGINVRQIVHLALDEAKRIPAAPPVPVDYSRLRVNVSEWIEQLEATNQDVLSTKLEVQQLVQQNESEKATATEDVYDEGWHRIVWLSEQYPLADGRVDAVSSQAKSTVPALESLRALQARIDGDAPPPLADAQADLDATITTLLTELGAAGLDTASLPDAPQGINVRQLVVDALEVAKRIPAAPPVPQDYDSLSRNIQECITELEVTTTEIVTVVEEVEAEWQANEAERAAMEEDIYDETYNRLDFNSKEGYPLVQSRLRDVANQAQPTVTAAKDLRELKRSVDAKEPRLRDAQNSLDKRLHGLVNDLGQRGVKIRWPPQPLRPKWEPRVPPGTSFVFREAVDKARRLPPPPRPPLRPASLNPPPDRPPRVWPPMVFRVPNLSEPRPRIRSRGVKPEPEDAIKRDPRVITLWGELCQTRGIVADTVGWEEVRAEAGAAAKGGGSNTPASARRPSTGGASAGLPSPRSGGKGGGSGAASALTTPRAAWGVRAASPTTPKVTPSPPRPGTAADSAAATPAEPELSAEEEAAYLPTLAARGAAIAAFEPNSLQEVADFVADVKAQGGDVPRSGHAAVTFPRSRWRAMVEAAAVFDELVEMCDTLTKWECDPQATSIAESHRLAAYMDRAAAAASRVMYAHDALRVRMQKAKLPWDDALLTDLRWASQRAAAATMQFSLDQLEVAIRRKGWNTGGILQPLGSAAIAAFKVHQFSGGFNMAAEKVYDELHERTVHYARMLDPKWLRSTKW